MKTRTLHAATRILPPLLERDRALAEDIVLFAVALRQSREPLWVGLAQEREGEALRWAEQWRRVSPDERHRALDRRFTPGEPSALALRELGTECGPALLGEVLAATPSFLTFALEGRVAPSPGVAPSPFGSVLARRLVRECVGPQPSRTAVQGSRIPDVGVYLVK